MKYFLIFLSVALLSCNGKPTNQETTQIVADANSITLTNAQLKNAAISIGRPMLKTINSSITVNGVVDVPPQNLISVSFPLGGYFKYTRLLPGMKVAKGEVIAVMEDQAFVQLQEEFLISKARLKLLEKDYARQKTLNTTKTSSDQVFEQTQTNFQTEKIRLNALSEKLKLIGVNPTHLNENNISRKINVYSPINGYVSAVRVNIGKYVNPTDVLFELINPDDLHLALTVFEKDLPLIQPGQKVKAHVTSDPSKVLDAQVLLVSKDVDANRSALVHCHFENNTARLMPGMFINAEIEIDNKPALTVPEEAVVRYEDRQYIFLAKGNNQFELTPVTTGVSKDGVIQINAEIGDLANKIVVTQNAYAILMKMKNTAE